MDEYVMKQKIQKAFFETRAPEELIQQVLLRAQAVVMGVKAKKQLETTTSENIAQLASRAVVGQLATVSELPNGAQPEQLAKQSEHQPAFIAALRGGNVLQRLNSGELFQQITGQKPIAERADLEVATPKKEGPTVC